MPLISIGWTRSPRVGYLAAGLIQGLAIVAAGALDGLDWPFAPVDWETSPSGLSRPIECGLILAFTLSPWLAMLAWETGRRARVAVAAGVLLVVIAGLAIHAQASFGGRANDVFDNAIAVAIILHVAALGLCLSPPAPGRWLPGDASIPVLRAGLTLAFGGLFAGVFMVTLWLWGALFELIGLDFFEELFDETEVMIPIATAATAFGIQLVRERERLRETLAGLLIVGARYLGAVVCAAIVLFIVSLPFTGLEVLWDTNSATALLVTVTLAILIATFLNAERSGESEGFGKPLLWLYAATLVLLPGLAALANYAIWLRVDQYGLTPERVLATVLAQVVMVKSIWGAAAVVLGRGDWRAWLPKGAAPLLALAILAALAVLTPIADPWALSARGQANRLIAGVVDAEAFDYGYLKFSLGRRGKAALKRVADTNEMANREVVARRLEYLAEAENYHTWRSELRAVAHRETLEGDLTAAIRPWPPGATVPDGLIDHLRRRFANNLVWCVKRKRPGRQCRPVVANMDEDSEAEVVFISLGSGGVRLFDRVADSWVVRPTIGGFSYQKVRKALEAGEIRTEPRVVHDLILGEERISFRPK